MPRPVDNPPNPWESAHVEYLGDPPPAGLCVYEEHARSIIARNDSPDVPFSFGVNPYRGCYHGCAYCYARPTHERLGFGAGTDFERRIVVKVNAAELLDRELGKRSWTGELLAFSGVTDCYQPLEAAYGITRACLEVCLRRRNPVGVITKGALIRRDAELLAELARTASAFAWLSVPFADDATGRAIEPWASPPSRRLEAMTALAAAGVPVGVAIAPVIPGLNDAEIPRILRLSREAGATRAFMVMLRLPGAVDGIFERRLREALPARAGKVMAAVVDARGGRRNVGDFGRRMVGSGPRWEAIQALFDAECRRLGLHGHERPALPVSSTARPVRPTQLRLL